MKTIEQFKDEYFFLSNFYPFPVVYNGVEYPTSEHAFQTAKVHDPSEKIWIKGAPTPGKAKYRGRGVTLREDWEDVKVEIMKNVILAKFSNEDLKKALLDTGDTVLVEGNTWKDTYWGVSLKTGRGKNVLGIILMAVREYYKENG